MNSQPKRSERSSGRLTVFFALAALFAGLAGAAVARATQSHRSAKSSTALVKAYGVKNAPITMEVFTDYQCPSCRAFYENTLRPMIADYVAGGKVYLIHHDFPLDMHKYSGEAARWADACAEVGQFEAAEAALYDNQDSWAADGNMGKFIAAAMPASDFKRVQLVMKGAQMPAPQGHGASVDPMKGVARPCPVDPYIAQDIKLAYQVPFNGTPGFIVSFKGQRVIAVPYAVSWPVLKQLFDSLLRG
ncbi:MAG TPA: thioredoxin domain-containing protein [Candidatus Baltobacteraceae bacterium]|nr:thioredoxin domain-containing protein [Candidatus Baltobacteraceae bacterium]